MGAFYSAVIAVEQKQTAYPAVESPFDTQILHAGGDDGGFLRADEKLHERLRKKKHDGGNDDTEAEADKKRLFCAAPDAVPVPGAVILGDEGGVGVSKILHRKIGEGIYLNSGGKGCHDRRAEAVDEPLNEKDAEIHDGLLQAGEEGKIPELF